MVSLTRDGGCNMMLGELETARRLGVAFTLIVVNNAASGYVKALQHLMYGARRLPRERSGRDALCARGRRARRARHPRRAAGALAGALAAGLRGEGVTVIDLVVTRDPAKMLPAADNRAVQVRAGDRLA